MSGIKSTAWCGPSQALGAAPFAFRAPWRAVSLAPALAVAVARDVACREDPPCTRGLRAAGYLGEAHLTGDSAAATVRQRGTIFA